MVLVMILLMTLLGLNPYVENSLVNTADCFVDYYQDIYKYKNIFNKDIMRYEVKTRCEDDISKNVSNNDELSKIDETGKQNNQSMGKCHLIVRPQDNGVCITGEVPLAYEYPKVVRRDPGNVGDIQEVVFKTGMIHKIITKAVNPPVFEIPSFFSHKECEYIIAKAQENGMEASGLVGENIKDQLESNKSLADIDRVSQTSWLWKKDIGNNVWLKLRERVSKLTLLPLTAVKQSEAIQVVQYQPGGHYHVHIDSTDNNYTLPCCFQSDRCQSLIHTSQWKECCRFCRFITVMVYLNDTEEGGQTAFPFADVDDATVKDMMNTGNWTNLSRGCHKSSLLVTPEKGKAVFWYNHGVDETGYIGRAIKQSHHGGCDVIKGTKWIANFWLLWPSYEGRSKMSRFHGEARDMPI